MRNIFNVLIWSLISCSTLLANIEITEVNNSDAGACNGSISVTAEGTASPFSIDLFLGDVAIDYISNVNGNITFYNLCEGDYSIVVNADLGDCPNFLDATVYACGEIGVNINIGENSGCGGSDGSFSSYSSPSGGNSPYTYLWNTGATTLAIDNLPSGNYSLTITDVGGCTGEFNYEIPYENEPFTSIVHSCEGEANGFYWIGIQNATSTYTFNWSTGASVSGLVFTELSGFAPGNYNITITEDNGNCEIIHEFEIEEILSNGPLALTEVEIDDICAGSSDGEIIISASGGNPPYEINWNNGMIGNVINNLSTGVYVATVTDDCGREYSKAFILQSFPAMILSLDDDSVEGCPGEITLDLEVTGGSAPYTYLWSNGQTVQDPMGLETGYYTVTVTDNIGCTKEKTIFAQQGFVYISDEVWPCQGFQNGSAKLYIYKQNLEGEVTAYIDGFPLYISSQNNDLITVDLENLYSEQEYNIQVTIGVCDFFIDLEMESNEVTRIYEDYNIGGNICMYTDYCNQNGTEIEIGEYEATGNIDYFNADNSSCSADVYCSDNENSVYSISFPKKWIRGYRYWQMLNALLGINGGPWGFDYINLLTNNLTSDPNFACDKYKYCPATMRRTFFGWGPNDAWAHPYNGYENLNNGCTKIKCGGLTTDFTICPGDSETWPAHILGSGPNYAIPITFCDAQYVNLYQMIVWHQYGVLDGLDNYSDGGSGSLREFIIQTITDPVAFEKAHCASVGFCTNTFDKWYDDLSEVECTTFLTENPDISLQAVPQSDGGCGQHCLDLPPSGGSLTEYSYGPIFSVTHTCDVFSTYWNGPETPDHQIVICGNQCGNLTCLRPVLILIEFDGFKSFKEKASIKLLTKGAENETLKNFSSMIGYGMNYPQGLIESNGTTKHYNYRDESEYVNILDITDAEWSIDDWDEESTLYCSKTPQSQEYQLTFEREENTWYNTISAYDITFDHLSKKDSMIWIGGSFEGQLAFDGQTVTSQLGHSCYLSQVDYDGQIIHQNIIENLDPNYSLVFSENVNGEVLVAGKYLNGGISVNNISFGGTSSANTFVLKIGLNNQVALLKELNVGADYDLLKLSYSDKDENYTLALSGHGQIDEGVNQLVNETTPQLVLISGDQNERINWTEAIGLNANISQDKLDIDYGSAGNLLLGMTYDSSFTFQNEYIEAMRGEDIVLFNIGTTGELIWHKEFATEEDENVSQVWESNGVVYFGGEFVGKEHTRQIGNYIFMNFSQADQKVYMSYVWEDNPDREEEERNTASRTKRKINESTLGQLDELSSSDQNFNSQRILDVIPNPFKDEFDIHYTNDVKAIEIIDIAGRRLLYMDNLQENNTSIDLSKYGAGLYIVKAWDSYGQLVDIKKVIKQ